MLLLRSYAVVLCTLLIGGFYSVSAAEGKRFAVVVGVKHYDHSKFPNLDFTENDATELSKILREAGYEVELLCDRVGKKNPDLLPNKANIEKKLDVVLNKCKRDDLVLIAFAGHGVQFSKDPDCYFCPSDARPFEDETKTLLSLDGLYRRLDKCGAGAKVLLADCCRNDPDASRGVKRSVPNDLTDRPPPKGVFACFSCSQGQSAYEHKDLGIGHGVFFYHVLEGLRGKAGSQEENVDFLELISYVNKQVPKTIRQKIGQGAEQTPNTKLNGSGPLTLLTRAGSSTVTVPRPTTPSNNPKTEPKNIGPQKASDKIEVGSIVMISVQSSGFVDADASTPHPDFEVIKKGTEAVVEEIDNKNNTYQIKLEGRKLWVRQDCVTAKAVSKK